LSVFGDNGGRDVWRDVGVMVEFHAGAGPALGHAAQVGGVAEHFAQRHEGGDFFDAHREVFHGFDAAALAVEVADDVAHELFGGDDHHFHDWFQQHRVGLFDAVLEAHRTGDAKGHFAGVYFVETAVVQLRLDVHHWVASQHAVGHGFFDALAYSRD